MIEPDYPAAHSMDTTFFAVDACGHVAVFQSQATGPVPRGCADSDVVRLARRLRGEADPADDEEIVDEERDAEYGPAFEEVVRQGMFVYVYYDEIGDEFFFPYTRTAAPDWPIHVDQLPPAVRGEFAATRMPTANFAAADKLQIIEQVPCGLWEGAVGYYLPGEKEVRPVPGRKRAYANALPGFRQKYPDKTFADARGAAPEAARRKRAAPRKAAPKTPAAKKRGKK